MKTKAYKLKENIARYIYKRITNAGYTVKVVWDDNAYGAVLLDDEYDDDKYYDLLTSIELNLGFKIYNVHNVTANEKGLHILWNKSKEIKTSCREINRFIENDQIERMKIDYEIIKQIFGYEGK